MGLVLLVCSTCMCVGLCVCVWQYKRWGPCALAARRRRLVAGAPAVGAAGHAARALHRHPTTQPLTRIATGRGRARSSGRAGSGPRCGRCPSPAPPPPCSTHGVTDTRLTPSPQPPSTRRSLHTTLVGIIINRELRFKNCHRNPTFNR